MYAVTGITGQVGGQIAHALLAAGQHVRAVVRDAAKGAPWAARGCEVALATSTDREGLTRAFAGVDGVFIMIPPDYDPAPGFPEIDKTIDALVSAIETSKPGKVVFLSTVGAHVERLSLLNNSRMIEAALRRVSVPVTFVRAGWFMENAAWNVADAIKGDIPSFLHPLDHPIPMVATRDIASTAARALLDDWQGTRVIELEAQQRYSANDIATSFAKALGRPVTTHIVPPLSWDALFRSQGMRYPEPRIHMLDGFNEGWIDFEGPRAERRIGPTTLDTIIAGLVEAAAQTHT